MPKIRMPQYVPPTLQTNVVILHANPVSTTRYPVLATTKNVRIWGLGVAITWAVTQPTPLEVVITIDGKTLTFVQANPVSGTAYYPYQEYFAPATAQAFTNAIESSRKAFFFGR